METYWVFTGYYCFRRHRNLSSSNFEFRAREDTGTAIIITITTAGSNFASIGADYYYDFNFGQSHSKGNSFSRKNRAIVAAKITTATGL